MRSVLSLLSLCVGLVSFGAHAWEQHQLLMPGIVGTLPSAVRARKLTVPSAADNARIYKRLQTELGLHATRTLPDLGFKPGSQITVEQLLLSRAVDEPDFGMDQDLPDAWDPQNERAWMGGKTGSSSQGFRHMYFGGWRLTRPLATFQLPLKAIGRAPARVGLLMQAADKLASEGQNFWSVRVTAWAMHFVQDLSQPFHSTQVPALKLVPWYHLTHWPIADQFKTFVPETTRVMANYHLGYERVIQASLKKEGAQSSDWAPCWKLPPDAWPGIPANNPELTALFVARQSSRLAGELGDALFEFFGPGIRRQGVALAKDPSTLDVELLLQDPGQLELRRRIFATTCSALGLASAASRTLVH